MFGFAGARSYPQRLGSCSGSSSDEIMICRENETGAQRPSRKVNQKHMEGCDGRGNN
jgi:hypothetical protein